MNCVLYARVSTDKQAEKELSIPAQLQAMRDYATSRGWSVVAEFIEPGASARTADRPSLRQLLGRVQQGEPKVDVVLVHKIDRLARSVHDHAVIKAGLQRQAVRLVSVVENVDESVSGELVENIMASIAQFYSANLSEEVKKGMRQKVMTGGWPHRPPRGYAMLPSGNRRNNVVEIHPTDGPLMKRAFELYATGWYSVKGLSQRLHQQGLTSRTGGPIPSSHLRRLLANSFYVGTVRWHNAAYAGTHPPLISRAIFDKVQQIIQERFKNPGSRGSAIGGFPLRGIAICASCRGRMTGERHDRWRYYRCSRQTYRRQLCAARLCNTDRVHAGLERICRRLTMNRTMAEEIIEAARSLVEKRAASDKVLRATLGREEMALDATEASLSRAFAAGDLTPAVFQNGVDELRNQRATLSKRRTTAPVSAEQLMEAVTRVVRLATSFWDLYQPLREDRQSLLLRQVFETVIVDHSGVAGFTLKPPFDTLFNNRNQEEPGALAETVLNAA